jgi:hypothetical protein
VNRFINDKFGSIRKKSGKGKSRIDDLPLKAQLEVVLAKFDDPLSAVLTALDPFHDKIVRPETKATHLAPKDSNYGLFRVIFWVRDDTTVSKFKFQTQIVEATDGFDARFKVETDYLAQVKSNDMKVVGIECLYVPRNHIRKINEDFPIYDQKGVLKVFAELELEQIKATLERFEQEEPSADLANFIVDDAKPITSP